MTTSTDQEDRKSDGAEGVTEVDGGGEGSPAAAGGTPSRPTTAVSVLEVALLKTNSSSGGDFGSATSTGNQDDGSFGGNGPTFRVICEVELSCAEAAVACALSADGRRLAVCLADGRIVTWVLPVFSPLSKGSRQHESGEKASERFDSAGEHNRTDGTADEHGDGSDGGASLGDSSTSLAGKDHVAATLTEKAAVAAGAAGAAATVPPVRLERPEFSLPRLPSSEELAYAQALQEYNRRVEAGELQEPTSSSGGGGEVEEGCTLPPRAPQLSGCAHHLARVEFLPVAAGLDTGSGGGGGGLSVWRLNSNVWRLYRLPPPPSFEEEGGSNDSQGVVTGADAGGEDTADQVTPEIDLVLPAKFDISSLPSAEWILPSPITALGASEADDGDGRGGGPEEDDHRLHHLAGGGAGCDWSCCGSDDASTAELAPLVAIGTENGGVFLCDAALGTTREALSRHRAQVTTLAFHRRRCELGTTRRQSQWVWHHPSWTGVICALCFSSLYPTHFWSMPDRQTFACAPCNDLAYCYPVHSLTKTRVPPKVSGVRKRGRDASDTPHHSSC